RTSPWWPGRRVREASAQPYESCSGRRRGRCLALVMLVRDDDDGVEEREEHDRAEDEARVGGTRVGPAARCDVVVFAHATLTLVMWSSCLICRMTSSPCVILPKTVCLPLRCRVLPSSSTMKNCEPPVSLPACAMERAPTSCVRGLSLVSH